MSAAVSAGTGRGSAVNGTLTSGRGRVVVENDTFTAFGRRVIRAAGRRVADGDVDGLPSLTALAAEVDRAVADAVSGLREGGYSWGEIASRLHISRQAAQQRWG